jgi:hypothetical protein
MLSPEQIFGSTTGGKLASKPVKQGNKEIYKKPVAIDDEISSAHK